MAKKPTYEELGKRVKELEKEFVESKRIEKSLRKSEEHYRILVENSHDVVYSVTPHGIISFASPQITRFGYAPEEVISKPFLQFVVPEQRQEVLQKFEQGTRDGSSFPTEFQWQGKGGRLHWVEVIGKITCDNSEHPFLQIGVMRDITERKNAEEALSTANEQLEERVRERTSELVSANEQLSGEITERKQAEEALRESEEHHRSFMESAKGFIVYRLEVDPENYFSGRLVFVSPGIEDEIGISPEAEFSEWFNNVHPDDLPALIEAQAKSVRNGDTFDQEFRWKNVKGEWGWCHVISNPDFDSDGNPAYYNGLMVNLTAQKQAEKSRFISSTLLTDQEREKKRISLDLHDELGQSLIVLKLQLKSIQRRLEEGQTELRSDCQAMLDYIVGLIENIRRICMDLTPGILDDLGLTAGIRWLVENALKSHDIDTSLDITNIDKLLTNEQQLLVFRIFQEAFTNIVRHSCASLTSIVIKRQGGEISLVIEDNGKGFDVKETMGRDFTEKGIGLSGMEERAWMLGGSVNIWSQRESGTRLEFRVPTE